MKLLADESVDFPIIARLRSDGHVVASILQESPGLDDEDVLGRAYRDGVVLLTADKDFGELVYRRQLPHAGVILLRLAGLDESSKCDLVSNAVTDRAADFPDAFSVLTADSLRIRPPPTSNGKAP